MAAISKVTYHRDVNAHNILAHLEGDRPPVSFGLVDFGLAVDASTWMDVSAANPLGKSEWEYLDVGGDCRYWPVSAWRQFEAGCKVLSQEEPLCTEYQTHLDLQGLGLTALQLLTSLLPATEVPELKGLKEAWRAYWDDASAYWASLLETFRSGGDWCTLKQDFIARKVHQLMATRLGALRWALHRALGAAAAANLTGEDSWPPGSASLFWALLAMVSCGERLETGWSEVCTRLARHGYVLPEPKRQKPRKEPKATLLGYTNKLKSLTAKVQELSMDFERLLPPLGEAR
ncbi:unnamed protein product [Durusdinium trenchii]